jgi:hypothetical protein
MRPLAGLLVVGALVGGFYYYNLKKMSSSDEGTSPTQAITLTGVRADLLQIAQAERSFVVTNGRCAPLNELMESGGMSMTKSERDGYQYSLECSNLEFNAVARHNPAPAGSGIRYPNLAVDQAMQFHEVN